MLPMMRQQQRRYQDDLIIMGQPRKSREEQDNNTTSSDEECASSTTSMGNSATSHDDNNDCDIDDALDGFIMAPCEDDRSEITTKIHNLSLEKLQGRQQFVGTHKRHQRNPNHHYHRHRRHSRSSPAQPQHTRTVQQQPSRGVARDDSRAPWSSLVWVMEDSDMTRSPSSSSHTNRSSSLISDSLDHEPAEKSQRILSVILDQDVELATNNITSSERSNASTTTSALASASTPSTVSTLSSSVMMVENDDPANYYHNRGNSSSVAAQEDKEEDSSTALMEGGQFQQFIVRGDDDDKVATRCQSSCCTNICSRSVSRWLFLLGCLLTLWIAIDGLAWARQGQSAPQEDAGQSTDDAGSDERKLLTGSQIDEESFLQSQVVLSPISRRNLYSDNDNGNHANDLSTAEKADFWRAPSDKNQAKQQWSTALDETTSWEIVDNIGHVPILDVGDYVPDSGLLDGGGHRGNEEPINISTDTTTNAPTEMSSYAFEPQAREEPFFVPEGADEQSDDFLVLNAEIVPATSSSPSETTPTVPPKTSSPTITTSPKTPAPPPTIPPTSFATIEEHLNQTADHNDAVSVGMDDSIFQMKRSSNKVTKKTTLSFSASLCFTLVGVLEGLHMQCCSELLLVAAGLLGVVSSILLERHTHASDILHVLSVHCFLAYATALLWLRYHPAEERQLPRRNDTKTTREDALLLADLSFTIGAAMAVVASYLTMCQDQAEMVVGIQRAEVFAAILWTAGGLTHLCCHLKSRYTDIQ